ncbi:hypothetical protein [Shewanella sp.]|uniref:hypothetical protein n=1 Tax=Shewanella sp. TaxID=50422 RepID=UPI0035689504
MIKNVISMAISGLLIAVGLLSSLLSPIVSAQESVVQEPQYLTVFQGDNHAQQIQAIETLIISGPQDIAVYDAIEASLKRSLASATDKHAIDYSSWLAKGLGYSGNEKYRATLTQIVEGDYHKKLRKYANEGITNIGQYAIWNPILHTPTHADLPPRLNAYSNALSSNDLILIRIAAKRIMHEREYSEVMLTQLSEQLTQPRLLDDSRLAIDTYAWLAKALASSGNDKFKAVIEDMANNAANKKLRSYAKKYLKTYF